MSRSFARAMLTSCVVLGILSSVAPSAASEACSNPVEVQGFKTCANIAKAEAEGAVVLYSPDVEQGTVKVLEAFGRAFPKINTNYVRLQTGALYAKIMAERQAKSYLADVVSLSDFGLSLDFQKRNGYASYISPQMKAYKAEYKSEPEGFFTWGAIILSGVVYNSKTMTVDEAPKDWSDLTDPKWAGVMSVKSSNSGLQHVMWYETSGLLGPEYWTKMGAQKLRPFDSYVQQFDRVVNGDDKLAVTAQYSGYLENLQKGTPLGFVFPASGSPAGPEVWGIVEEAPHPEAARLLLDWFLSPIGQKAMEDALYMQSPRSDVTPPPGGKPLSDIKILIPKSWPEFLATRKEFVRLWQTISGLR